MFRKQFLLVLLTLVFSSVPALAYVVEPVQVDPSFQDFVVGPGKTDLEISPGQNKVIEVTVANRTGKDREFEIKFSDFVGSGDLTSPIIFTSEKGAYSLRDYLTVPEKKFFLKNGERARIPVSVKIPLGAEPGGRYASVLVSTITPIDKNDNLPGAKSGVPLITQTGTLIFVNVPGNVKTEGRLATFKTSHKSGLYSYSREVVFDIVFENTGRIHLSPSGTILVKNIFGNEVRRIELGSWFSMPQAMRLREVNLVPSAKDNIFMFGRYTALATISRGYNNLTDEKIISFWVLPWKWLVLIVFILAFIIFLIRLLVRWMRGHLVIQLKADTLADSNSTPDNKINTPPSVS